MNLPSGNSGRKDLSTIRLAKISFSVGPNSLLKKFVGIRPAAAAFNL